MGKNLLLLMVVFGLHGCQSYPKNPSSVSLFDSRVAVNKNVPSELQPFVDLTPMSIANQQAALNENHPENSVPVAVYTLTDGETLEDFNLRQQRAKENK